MRHTFLTAGALAFALVLGGCADSVTQGADTADDARPPAGTGPVDLWLSATDLPTDGADLVSVIRNGGDVDALFGVLQSVDRWTNGEWTSVASAGACLPHWHCLGEVSRLGIPAIPSIGVGAAAGGTSSPLAIRVEGLEPGWYRLRSDGHADNFGGPPAAVRSPVVATGIFRVRDGAPAPDPVDDIARQETLALHPVLVGPGGGTVATSLLMQNLHSALAMRERSAQVLPGTAVQRWDGAAWTPVTTLETPPPSGPNAELGSSIELTLPELAPGSYRLLRTFADGAVAPGLFWVVDESD